MSSAKLRTNLTPGSVFVCRVEMFKCLIGRLVDSVGVCVCISSGQLWNRRCCSCSSGHSGRLADL